MMQAWVDFLDELRGRAVNGPVSMAVGPEMEQGFVKA